MNYYGNNEDIEQNNVQQQQIMQLQSPEFQEDGDVKGLISKRKEQYSVEIRKKEVKKILRQSRLQISEVDHQKRYKEYVENDNLDVKNLNINISIEGFLNAYKQNNLELIKFEVNSIRLCVSLEHKLAELEYSNAMLYDKGVLPFLFTYLTPQYDSEFELQRDALWIITHFIGDQSLRNTLFVIENVPVVTFYRLALEGKAGIQQNALLAIFDILNEYELGAQYLIQNNIVQFIYDIITQYVPNQHELLPKTISIIRDLFEWANKPNTFIPLETLMPILNALITVYAIIEKDSSMASDLFDALKFIVMRDNEDVEEFYNSCNGLVLKTINFIEQHKKQNHLTLLSPLLVLHNLSNGYDTISEGMIQFGLLDIMSYLAKHKDIKIQRLCFSTLSNVCASGKRVVSSFMQHKVIVMDILNAMEFSEFSVKTEAIDSFCHLLMTVSIKQISDFIEDYNALKVLIDLINKYVDASMNSKILRALLSALEKGQIIQENRNYFFNPIARKFNKLGGREKAQEMCNSNNEKIKKAAEQILAISYLVDQDDQEYEGQQQEDDSFDQEDVQEFEENDNQVEGHEYS